MAFTAKFLVFDDRINDYAWKTYTVYDEKYPSEYKDEEASDAIKEENNHVQGEVVLPR